MTSRRVRVCGHEVWFGATGDVSVSPSNRRALEAVVRLVVARGAGDDYRMDGRNVYETPDGARVTYTVNWRSALMDSVLWDARVEKIVRLLERSY